MEELLLALGRLTEDVRIALTEAMRARLSPHRFRHVLGVANTARELAERFGADADKAELAALLHDCAREWRPPALLEKAQEWGIEVGEMERSAPMPCLHAPLGAEVAKREFGVDDSEILEAIASHTLGREAMGQLEKILFLADAIEPGRGEAPYLAELRHLAQSDLDHACRRAFDHTFEYLLTTGQPIHPQSTAGRNWLIKEKH